MACMRMSPLPDRKIIANERLVKRSNRSEMNKKRKERMLLSVDRVRMWNVPRNLWNLPKIIQQPWRWVGLGRFRLQGVDNWQFFLAICCQVESDKHIFGNPPNTSSGHTRGRNRRKQWQRSTIMEKGKSWAARSSSPSLESASKSFHPACYACFKGRYLNDVCTGYPKDRQGEGRLQDQLKWQGGRGSKIRFTYVIYVWPQS